MSHWWFSTWRGRSMNRKKRTYDNEIFLRTTFWMIIFQTQVKWTWLKRSLPWDRQLFCHLLSQAFFYSKLVYNCMQFLVLQRERESSTSAGSGSETVRGWFHTKSIKAWKWQILGINIKQCSRPSRKCSGPKPLLLTYSVLAVQCFIAALVRMFSVTGLVVAVFLVCEDLGIMFDNSFPTCAFFFSFLSGD